MSEENLGLDWWDDVAPSEVTLEQMNKLCGEIGELRDRKDDMSEALKEVNGKLMRAEAQLIQYLKESGMKNIKNDHGNFSITTRTNVNQPVDREAFVEYLKSKGEFENMYSFNSQKLKSYVMAEIEEKVREGQPNWLPPGITAPSEFETISFRKK